MLKKYVVYLLRWQLSTPILALVLIWLSDYNVTFATIVANLIGGMSFFFIDKLIFKPKHGKFVYWEIEDDGVCVDCGYQGEVRRVVINGRYDRQFATKKFRCKKCAQLKLYG